MAQIFISHSQKDEEILRLFKDAFVGTNVKAIFESLEKIIKGKIPRDQIGRDIENSRAIFVILSQNVEKIPHTRDWVVCETGFAKNKDIWVFEPYSRPKQCYVRCYIVNQKPSEPFFRNSDTRICRNN